MGVPRVVLTRLVRHADQSLLVPPSEGQPLPVPREPEKLLWDETIEAQPLSGQVQQYRFPTGNGVIWVKVLVEVRTGTAPELAEVSIWKLNPTTFTPVQEIVRVNPVDGSGMPLPLGTPTFSAKSVFIGPDQILGLIWENKHSLGQIIKAGWYLERIRRDQARIFEQSRMG